MKKIEIYSQFSKKTFIIDTDKVTFLEQQNNEATFVYCFGGDYFHIPADIMDVYTLLFYEGKHINIGNAYSEELPKKIDKAQINAYNERP